MSFRPLPARLRALSAATLLLLGAGPLPAGGGRPPVESPRTEIPPPQDRGLRPGDTIVVNLAGIPDDESVTQTIDDQGNISLKFINQVRAAGQSESELALEIQRRYVEARFYNSINVSVSALQRFVSVGGRVNRPGPVVWTSDLTLVKAIQAAGDFSIYARRGGVVLARDGRSYTINVQDILKDPRRDIKLYPGDTVSVPRSNL